MTAEERASKLTVAGSREDLLPAPRKIFPFTRELSGNASVSGRELDLSGLPKAPYEEDGVLMVPLRLIGEALGYTVGWDPESGAITVDDDDIQKATLFDGSAAVSFEGRLKVIDMTHQWENDAPTACYEGCTYVPLTFFETFFNDVSFQNGLISVSPSMAELN